MLYVSYLRVSTKKQSKKRVYAEYGLGIEAQHDMIYAYTGCLPLQEFVEVESGARIDRPKLQEALALCRLTKAKLVVAKLDRLARDAAFVCNLLNSDVEFVACDFPTANRMLIQILAVMAEYERSLISDRTKKALAVLKEAGVKLGNPNATSEGRRKGVLANQRCSQEFNSKILPIIQDMKEAGKSPTEIARRLNEAQVKTIRGKTWGVQSVINLLNASVQCS